MPAGNAMNVRTTGSRRPSRTVMVPYFSKEVRHAVEVVMAHQDPAAVALDQRTAAFGADPVGDHRAKIAAQWRRPSQPRED